MISDISFAPDSKTLASTSGNSIILWDISRLSKIGEPIIYPDSINFEHSSFCVATSKNGKFVASGGIKRENSLSLKENHKRGSIILWDSESDSSFHLPDYHQNAVSSISFHPSKEILASVSNGSSYDVNRFKTNVSFSLNSDSIETVFGDDYSIVLWDLEKSEQIPTPFFGHNSEVREIEFNPSGNILFSCGCAEFTKFNMPSSLLDYYDKIDSLRGATSSYDVSIDSLRDSNILSEFFECNKGLIQFWDFETYDLIDSVHAHSDWINCISLSSDGELMASGGVDGNVILWDWKNKNKIDSLHIPDVTINSLNFSPDDNKIAAGISNGSIVLWDFKKKVMITEKLVFLGGDTYNIRNGVNSIAFNSNGKIIVAGLADGSINIWDTETNQRIGPKLFGHLESFKLDNLTINGISFIPDEDLLISGAKLEFRFHLVDRGFELTPEGIVMVEDSVDKHIGESLVIWDLDLDNWIKQAEETSNRALSDKEKSKL